MKAWAEKSPVPAPWENPATNAPGLRVPSPFGGRQILQVLRDTDGLAVAVSEAEIVEAQKLMARMEGIWTAPEAAATLAGLIRLKDAGRLERQARIVLLLTGAGIKNPPPSLPPPLDLTGPEATLLERVKAALGR